MDDPSKFASLMEYNMMRYAIGLLLASECVIWFYTTKGTHGRSKPKRFDIGTVWLVVMGWCFCLMAGAYCRGENVPAEIRGWLLPHFVYYIGIIFIVCGIIIRCMAIWTSKQSFVFTLHEAMTPNPEPDGLYRIVRNPEYTGSIISLLGVALVFQHILGVAAVLAACIICYAIRLRVRERVLREWFPEEFGQYCAQTKYRLIPRIY